MTANRTILVTGALGQLGSCLQEMARGGKHKFIFTDLAELDITSVEAVGVMFAAQKPDWVVNCAAYTAVDKAQSEPAKARLLNATAAGILSEQAAKIGASIVHISTDYVFKGDNPNPLTETDPTDPQSVYGATKLEGERLVIAANKNHIILRTSWLYSAYGNNFVKTMRRLGAEKSDIGVVADQWGSPTSAHDLARAIITVIENPHYGLYHFANQGVASWALFAQEIMDLSDLDCTVNYLTSSQYPTAAHRPEYSLLDKSKFCSTFGLDIPEWEESLERVIKKLDS